MMHRLTWILICLLVICSRGLAYHDGDVYTYSISIPDSIDTGTIVTGYIYDPSNMFGTPVHTDTLEKKSGMNIWWDQYTIPTSAEHGTWQVIVSLIDGGTQYDYTYEFVVLGYFDPDIHMAAFVDSVWNEAKANHTADGTYGGDALDADIWTDTRAGKLDYLDASILTRMEKSDTSILTRDAVWTDTKAGYLDAAVSSVSGGSWAGSGSENVDFYVRSQDDSTVLANAYIHVYTVGSLTAASQIAHLSTSSSGIALFALDPDTLYCAVNYQAYRVVDTLYLPDIDTTMIHTVYLDVSPPTPSLLGACNLSGCANALQAGAYYQAIVSVYLLCEGIPRITGGFITPQTAYKDTANATTGIWSFDLYHTADITDDNGVGKTRYEIWITGTNVAEVHGIFSLPDSTSITIDQLDFE